MVTIKHLNDYNLEKLEKLIRQIFIDLNFENKIKPKMKILLKVNMQTPAFPDQAETTNPNFVQALVNVLSSMGAKCIVADSLDKKFTHTGLDTAYFNTGLLEVANSTKCVLNSDLSVKTFELQNGVKTKSLTLLNVVNSVDAIINVGKLKFDEKLGICGATANLFGLIPNRVRLRLLNRFNNISDYNEFLVDLVDGIKDKLILNMIDAVVSLEANKTQRMTYFIGASENVFSLDSAIFNILNINYENTVIKQAISRKYLEKSDLFQIKDKNLDKFRIEDFAVTEITQNSLINKSKLKKSLYFNLCQEHVFIDKNKCKGCSVCSRICPTGAIKMKYDKHGELYANVDYNLCIHCNKCVTGCPYLVVEHKKPIGYKISDKKIIKN